MLESTITPGETRVRASLAKQFTSVEASALLRLALRVPGGTTIDVDFREVRLCQDAALLVLARSMAAGAAHYAFHGLSHHQATILGYLGADIGASPEAETN